MVDLVTPADVRLRLEMTEGELPDARILPIITEVSGLILEFCNRTTFEVTEDAVTIDLDGSGTSVILLPVHPVAEVVSVTEDARHVDTAVELEEDVDFEWSANGVLRRLGARWARRARWYRVVFRHGYEATPATALSVAHRVIARTVTNPEGLASETLGADVIGYLGRPALDELDRADLERFRVQVGA